MTLHWAAAYIGKPWKSAARGPNAYDCWGLVMRLCQIRLGIQMPSVAVGTKEQQFNAILEASRGQGWYRVEGPPQTDDVLLMRNRAGDRHCGYMVHDGKRLRVLHADGHMTSAGPVGCVVAQTIDEAIAGGYREHEFWRHEK